MQSLVVGVGDCKVSGEAESTLITYALGSCIAVMIYDPVATVGGLLHFVLPDSNIDKQKASKQPFMFADTGLPALFKTAYSIGAEKKRMVVSIAGGAQIMDEKGTFNIGKRNYLALKKILWRAGVLIRNEDVGGDDSRTVRLDVATGSVWIRSPGRQERPLTTERLSLLAKK